ncbi:PepSY domain-containing protein [Segnochrobactrum spirostomi]|uniref:PepSY domain-containing protein n=1 Tax=Segnochrobactrum spirostomi TaxID=2608987 RepID=A0A6A7Y3G0_9HYPH|nr:PepSY domain-containing protein [Segnochrobactrum spirostomi]MQT12309.1 PepSY domain-containing protein [Segnochrobactrum spirostomi]
MFHGKATLLCLLMVFAGFGEAHAACLDAAAQRAAIQSGAVVRPNTVRKVVNGELLDLTLCEVKGKLVYEATVLKSTGEVVRLLIDAKTGALAGR